MTATDYDPFGMQLDDRNLSSSTYRFGFNGKENDPEVAGQQDYGFRIYDRNLARFKSVDPLTKSYPWNSTFAFAENSPIKFIDLDGLEEYDPTQDPFFTSRLILTTWFDVKHSLENLLLNTLTPPNDPALKWQASYKIENGEQKFETEIKKVPKQGALKEVVNKALDVVNVVAAGKIDATDVLAAKTPLKNQLIETTRKLIGAGGAKFSSITLYKQKGSKARIDVENPNPGKRDGQIHYQDENNTKYLYDLKENKFFGKNKETGAFDVPAPNKVNDLLKVDKIKDAINKGKQYLNEK